MEVAPPTYEAATSRNYLRLVAPYVRYQDLPSLLLVNSTWYAAFATELWGNPRTLRCHDKSRTFQVFQKFILSLRYARLAVRRRIRTVTVPSMSGPLFCDLGTSWLKEICQQSPNLQSLVLDGTPFLDHANLNALSKACWSGKWDDVAADASGLPDVLAHGSALNLQSVTPALALGELKMLSAVKCENVTAHALRRVLQHCLGLMYLDLSHTRAARSSEVLTSVSYLHQLQVLKLCGIGLRDIDCLDLAISIECRVRSLDISDNLVTDHGVNAFLRHCFVYATDARHDSSSQLLSLYKRMSHNRDQHLAAALRQTLIASFVGQLALECLPETGIVEIFIAGNSVSKASVEGILKTRSVHVLDIGRVTYECVSIGREDRSTRAGQQEGDDDKYSSSLLQIILECAAHELMWLRVHHSLLSQADFATDGEYLGGYFEKSSTQSPSHKEAANHPLDDHSQKRCNSTDIDVTHSCKVELHSRVDSSCTSLIPTRAGRVEICFLETTLDPSQHAIKHGACLPATGTPKRTVVLCDIPVVASDIAFSTELCKIVSHCTWEQWWVDQRSRHSQSLYRQEVVTVQSLESITPKPFIPERLVFEISTPATSNEMSKTRAVTGDEDSEVFWNETEQDFSFFRNPAKEMDQSTISPKIASAPEKSRQTKGQFFGDYRKAYAQNRSANFANPKQLDVVSSLSSIFLGTLS